VAVLDVPGFQVLEAGVRDLFAEQLVEHGPAFYWPLPDRPPGMTGDDVELYDRWRRHPHVRAKRAWFNVRVGPDAAALARTASDDARLAAMLAAPRIDMLLDDGAGWWVVEFHGQAALPQLGRLLGYAWLLPRTYTAAPPVRLLLVGFNCNPFLLGLFDRYDVAVVAYRDLDSPLEVCVPGLLLGRTPGAGA